MNMKLLFLLALIFVLNACQNTPSKYIYNKGFVYGTMYSIVYESPNGKDFHDEIKKEFSKYTMIFSTYEKESTISKINNNIDTKPEPVFIDCYNRSVEVSDITNGAFDITCGQLVNAWGFGPDEKSKMTSEKVDSLLQVTGYKKITINKGKFRKANPEMKLDMSAIAKG
ncbi:MAG: FAD:protein FMN transferase, partial [Bacteroidota bacterium]